LITRAAVVEVKAPLCAERKMVFHFSVGLCVGLLMPWQHARKPDFSCFSQDALLLRVQCLRMTSVETVL